MVLSKKYKLYQKDKNVDNTIQGRLDLVDDDDDVYRQITNDGR
jgi:hypothetical protein